MTAPDRTPASRFARTALWCARHRWQTITIWIVAVAAALGAGQATGTKDISTEFGLGLAIAVLLDAVIVRCLLVPAVMELFGARAWWLPSWLDRRLPRIALERD